MFRCVAVNAGTTPAPLFRPLAAVLVMLLTLATSEVLAEPLPDFPNASLEERRDIVSTAHRVMLSPISEVRDEVRAESSARIHVAGTGSLYRILTDSSRADARDWYLDQLEARGARLLFQCSGRDCGRSNVWANQVFGESTLYGRDANQDYLVAGYADSDGQRWLVLIYTITRGNQREYLWLEQLALAPGSTVPGLNLNGGRAMGPVIVPWSGSITINFDWAAEDRSRLQAMMEQPGSRVVIAAFSDLKANENLEQALARAEKAGMTMSDLLSRSGVPRSLHVVRSIGPTVKTAVAGRPENRIELLVITPPTGGQDE